MFSWLKMPLSGVVPPIGPGLANVFPPSAAELLTVVAQLPALVVMSPVKAGSWEQVTPWASALPLAEIQEIARRHTLKLVDNRHPLMN